MNTDISEAVGKETVLEDGRTVLTVLYDRELHDLTWRLYADLKCDEHDDCIRTSLQILDRIEQYPGIDARYIELADALDIIGDVATHIEDGRFYPDWESSFDVEDEEELVERLNSGICMIRERLGLPEE